MTSEVTTSAVKQGFRFHPKTHPHLVRRVIIGVAIFSVLMTAAYFAAVTWGIRHRTLALYDSARQRPVTVDIAVRRDVKMRADAGMTTMPVAIINQGNTVRFTEYSFLSNFFAGRLSLRFPPTGRVCRSAFSKPCAQGCPSLQPTSAA